MLVATELGTSPEETYVGESVGVSLLQRSLRARQQCYVVFQRLFEVVVNGPP